MINENLQPSYESRKFYGPLQLDPDMPQPQGRNFLIHPDDPSKLIRFNSAFAADESELNERVAGTQRVIADLSRYGIPHVNPIYINGGGGHEGPDLIIVVDRLDNAHSYDQIVSGNNLNSQIAGEVDLTLCRMLEHVGTVVQQGGFVDTEMMRLDQFAYDSSRPTGQKMVLVDVEPLGAGEVEPLAESIQEGEYYPGGYPTDATQTTARLIVDMIELAQKIDYPFKSFQVAADIVGLLPGNSPQTNTAKELLLTALDNREVSQEIFNLAICEKIDYTDWLYGDDE